MKNCHPAGSSDFTLQELEIFTLLCFSLHRRLHSYESFLSVIDYIDSS